MPLVKRKEQDIVWWGLWGAARRRADHLKECVGLRQVNDAIDCNLYRIKPGAPPG